VVVDSGVDHSGAMASTHRASARLFPQLPVMLPDPFGSARTHRLDLFFIVL